MFLRLAFDDFGSVLGLHRRAIDHKGGNYNRGVRRTGPHP